MIHSHYDVTWAARAELMKGVFDVWGLTLIQEPSLEWKGYLYCYTCKHLAGYQCAIWVCIDFLNLKGREWQKKKKELILFLLIVIIIVIWCSYDWSFALIYNNSNIYLCAKIYFVYKIKNIVSKRDSPVKCSIDLLKMFIYVLQWDNKWCVTIWF